MQIRKLCENDYDSVGQVYSDAFEYPLEVYKHFPGFKAYFDFFMNEGYSYVAENEEGEVVGVVLGYETPDMIAGISAHIDLLAVKKTYQNYGYGKALLEAYKAEVKARNVCEMSVKTKCYIHAYDFYKRNGFQDSKLDFRYMCAPTENNDDKENEE